MDTVTTVFAVGAAVVVGGVVAKSFMGKPEIPEPEFDKPKKLTKAEKKAKKAAEAALDEPDEPVVSEKQLKKRAKEQAKKEAKRQEKAAAIAAKAAEQKQAAEAKKKEEAEAAAAAAGAGKKKKKKKGKKAAEPEAAAAPAVVEKVPEPEDDDWSVVAVSKKSSKKAADLAPADKNAPPEANVEFDCDPKEFPKIFGTGGSNLKAIQEATGCDIDVPKKGAHRTSIVISGTKAGCLLAKKNLKMLVEKGYCDITQPNTTDEGIDVPSSKIGAVIGRGGENIKIITAKTGAKVNMPDRDSGSNTVTVTGPAEAVKEALGAIKELMEKGFSSLTHANHTMANVNVHRDFIGTILGTRGATIQKLQTDHKVKINMPNSGGAEFVVCTLVGEATDVINARIAIEGMLVAPEPEPIAPEWTQANILKNLDLSW